MRPVHPASAPARHGRARTIAIAILTVVAAPFLFVAFLATFNRSR